MPVASLIAIIQALVAFAPQIPEIVNGIETAVRLAQTGVAPTPEEQATIDAALDAAHAAVQAA
jgi:hypothetical protein